MLGLRQAAAKKSRVVRIVDQKTAVVPLHADTLADPNKLLASVRSLLELGCSVATVLGARRRHRPEKTPLYKIISENLESWLQWREATERPVPAYVEDELRGYLECGLLCFGFARVVCMTCRTGFVVAFCCKGRGVCPSCNGRHMAQTAAHLVDHVIPPVPVRQWVISVPKRLRGFLANRPAAVNALTKIFLDEIELLLCAAAGVTDAVNTPTAACPRLGGISFLHRFGSALNHHVHLHACVTDGVFVPAATATACDTPPAFIPARPICPGRSGRARCLARFLSGKRA